MPPYLSPRRHQVPCWPNEKRRGALARFQTLSCAPAARLQQHTCRHDARMARFSLRVRLRVVHHLRGVFEPGRVKQLIEFEFVLCRVHHFHILRSHAWREDLERRRQTSKILLRKSSPRCALAGAAQSPHGRFRARPARRHSCLARSPPQASAHRPRTFEQPHLRLQKAVELAGVADDLAGDAALHPALHLARDAVAQHRLHVAHADQFQRLLQSIRRDCRSV